MADGATDLITARLAAARAWARRHPTAVTLAGMAVVLGALAFALHKDRHEFVTALGAAPLWVLGAAVALHLFWLRRPQRGLERLHPRGRRQRRPAAPLPRLEPRLSRQHLQRPVRAGGADRGAAAQRARRLAEAVGPARGRVPGDRGRGRAGGDLLVHAGRPARAALVVAARRLRGDRRADAGAAAPRAPPPPRVLERARGAARPARAQPDRRPGLPRGGRPDPAELAAAELERGRRLGLRRDRAADRARRDRAAAGRARASAPRPRS